MVWPVFISRRSINLVDVAFILKCFFYLFVHETCKARVKIYTPPLKAYRGVKVKACFGVDQPFSTGGTWDDFILYQTRSNRLDYFSTHCDVDGQSVSRQRSVNYFSHVGVLNSRMNPQNYWVFGPFPSSGILVNTKFRKLDLFPSSGCPVVEISSF
jgi:hypothetical protein